MKAFYNTGLVYPKQQEAEFDDESIFAGSVADISKYGSQPSIPDIQKTMRKTESKAF